MQTPRESVHGRMRVRERSLFSGCVLESQFRVGQKFCWAKGTAFPSVLEEVALRRPLGTDMGFSRSCSGGLGERGESPG